MIRCHWSGMVGMLLSGACLVGCVSATQKAQREVQQTLTAEQYQWNGAAF